MTRVVSSLPKKKLNTYVCKMDGEEIALLITFSNMGKLSPCTTSIQTPDCSGQCLERNSNGRWLNQQSLGSQEQERKRNSNLSSYSHSTDVLKHSIDRCRACISNGWWLNQWSLEIQEQETKCNSNLSSHSQSTILPKFSTHSTANSREKTSRIIYGARQKSQKVKGLTRCNYGLAEHRQ